MLEKGKELAMKKKRRCIAMILTVCMLALSTETITVKADDKQLTVEMAKNIGLSNSSSYKLLENKLELAYVQYEQAVKALRLKEKNQTTFRWSPVLEFSFPEAPNLSEGFEYEYKPIEMQSNIDVLKHQINDHVYQIYGQISSLFVKVYVLQEQIAFNEIRLEDYTETLNKNRARLLLGLANASDISSMEKKVAALEATLIADKSNFEAQKKKLSDLLNMDINNGYSFESPFVDGEIDRELLEMLIEHTLEVDHTYYQAKIESANALLALNTNYQLMKGQYGSKMSMLDGYINQIKSGNQVDSSAFKLKYNEFLKLVDKPWEGYKTIWFVKIPKEWFKGDIDGVRYVEDEPYILYETAIEYQNALKEQDSIKKEITTLVTDTFENYVSAKKAVETIQTSIATKREELDISQKLNLSGRMTYEEYNTVREEYEELQIELIQIQGDYSQILYEFNRLTCGKIEELLKGITTSVNSGSGGYSYVVEDEGTGIYYYIHQMVSENVFEFGLTESENYDVEFTHFELWINQMQLGQRTAIGSSIKHLSIDLQQTDRVFVRIYNGNEFVDDCDIDPSICSGKLTVIKNYTVVSREDDLLGTYGVTIDEMGLLYIDINPSEDKLYTQYNIMTTSGVYLLSEEKLSVKQSLKYLGLAQESLEELVINLYDENNNLLYKARFCMADKTIRKIEQ